MNDVNDVEKSTKFGGVMIASSKDAMTTPNDVMTTSNKAMTTSDNKDKATATAASNDVEQQKRRR